MPISVTCTQCGKGLRVKDDWAGKRAKCPQCGNTFTVAAPGTAPAAGPTVFSAKAAAAAKGQREKEAGKFSVSWGLVFGVGAVVLAIVLVGMFIAGPKRVWGEWEKIGDTAYYDVISVVSRGLQAHASAEGMYNPRKGSGPQATEVMFFRPGFVMSMPDDVDFKGTSSMGEFKGVYHPHTGEIEADVDVGGMGLPGVGAVRKGGVTIKVTGRVKDGKITTEVNGKKADIVYPAKDEDE